MDRRSLNLIHSEEFESAVPSYTSTPWAQTYLWKQKVNDDEMNNSKMKGERWHPNPTPTPTSTATATALLRQWRISLIPVPRNPYPSPKNTQRYIISLLSGLWIIMRTVDIEIPIVNMILWQKC